MNKARFQNALRYGSFIILGTIMIFMTSIKLFGVYDFSSDWFWFIAAIGLFIEGIISLNKQKKFDRKYKIIEIGSDEYKKLYATSIPS